MLARAKAVLKQELLSLPQADVHDEVRSMFRALAAGLCVLSGGEALQLLVRSERVFFDLLLALDFRRLWTVHIVVREWSNLPIEAEFR